MIVKKVNQDLRNKNIEFQIDHVTYKAVRFYQTQMTVDVIVVDGDDTKGIKNIPFAYIPKASKKLIKPN